MTRGSVSIALDGLKPREIQAHFTKNKSRDSLSSGLICMNDLRQKKSILHVQSKDCLKHGQTLHDDTHRLVTVPDSTSLSAIRGKEVEYSLRWPVITSSRTANHIICFIVAFKFLQKASEYG